MANRRLAIDGRMLAEGAGTGVATYARAVARAQARIAAHPLIVGDDPAVRGSRPARWLRALWPGGAGLRDQAGSLVGRDIFRRAQVHFDIWGRPLVLRAPGPPGLIHWSYPLPLRIAGWINLYTIHDAIPLVYPDLTPIDPARYRRLIAAIARVADHFVTVSAAAAAEIADATGIAAGRITNCHQSIDAVHGPLGVLPAGLMPGGYFLAVGTVEPRKNVARLIIAHAEAATGLPLVIAGPDGWNAPEERARAPAPADIVRVPYVDAPTMRALISHARALAMPSLAEGFGLPVAEGMALGTPVITSDFGALAEIAGGAALLVDPRDPAAIAAALRATLDDALAERLSAAGRVRAGAFTDAKFADRLAALYARLFAAAGHTA